MVFKNFIFVHIKLKIKLYSNFKLNIGFFSSYFRNFMLSVLIKCSVIYSCLSSFLVQLSVNYSLYNEIYIFTILKEYLYTTILLNINLYIQHEFFFSLGPCAHHCFIIWVISASATLGTIPCVFSLMYVYANGTH